MDKETSLYRILIASGVMLLIYLGIIYKLKQEQLSSGNEHRKKVSEQSVREIRLPAVRGRMFTSDYKHILADNKVTFNVVFHLAEMRQPGRRKKTLNFIIDSSIKIAQQLGRESTITEKDIRHHMNYRPGLPMAVFKDLTKEELGIISELYPPLQGMEVKPVSQRIYPHNNMAGHIVGYVRNGDPKNAYDRDDFFYYVPDQVGRAGLESLYDLTIPESDNGFGALKGLRGKAGKRTVRVDHRGYIFEQIGFDLPSTNGNDLVLTLDYKAQKIMQELLKENKDKQGNSPLRAGFALINARTGAVVSMVSSPDYDLNNFVPRISSKVWNKLLNDPFTPLVNRATSAFTPGSIVKPLVGLSVIDDGVSAENTHVCNGRIRVGNRDVRCWNHSGHGTVNLYDSIKGSCNVYFIAEGLELGLEKISSVYRSAGLGSKTGLPIFEYAGLTPNREKHRQKYNRSWNSSDTARLSIGQGEINVSPLQAALYCGAFANGGTLMKPYLLKELRDPNGNKLFETRSSKNGMLKASRGALEKVRQGMWQVVNAEHGASAKAAINNHIKLFGKTGTAQNGGGSNRWNNTWFVGFGNYKKDNEDGTKIDELYAFALIVEHGVSGGKTSAPIIGQFFERWLRPEIPK